MAAAPAAPPISEQSIMQKRLADVNRLVVRNTFLDIDCDDGEEDYDSDSLETGDFHRASTEPVPMRGDVLALAGGVGSGCDVLGGVAPMGFAFRSTMPGTAAGAACAAGLASPALPEEEPLYVFSHPQRADKNFSFGRATQLPPRPSVPFGSAPPSIASQLLPAGLQAAGRPPGAGWPAPPHGSSLDPYLGIPPYASSASAAAPVVGGPAGATGGGAPQPGVEACFGSGSTALGSESLDVGLVAQAASTISSSAAEQAALVAIREMVCSVAVGDPSLPDCPLIGCSDGFETLTGYTRAEIIGQNCRFLNRGMRVSPSLRARLRDATMNGNEFIGVVPNMRKNGKRFQNLLHMTTLTVRDRKYIVAVQADASHISIDPRNAGHRAALEAAADRIFSGNIDAWIQIQAREFSIRLPAPLSQLLKLGSPVRFAEEQGSIVRIGNSSIHSSEELEHVGDMSRSTTAATALQPEKAVAVRPGTATPGGAQDKDALLGDASKLDSDQVPGSQTGKPALKSVGSVGHPDNCVECCFHFFGPNGCRAAENCDFCHEFHPRKNAKKNRRLIKRLANNTESSPIEQCKETAEVSKVDEGGSSQDQSHMDSQASTSAAAAPTPTAATAPPQDRESGRDTTVNSNLIEATDSRPECTTSDMADHGNSDLGVAPNSGHRQQTSSNMVHLTYGAPSQTAAGPKLTLISGVRTELAPMLVFSTDENRQVLEGCLKFVVEPALPAGLELEASTGVIRGTPQGVLAQTSYLVTVKTVALGPGGIALGEVPLAHCNLECSVLDLSQLTLSLPCQAEDSASNRHFSLTFKAS